METVTVKYVCRHCGKIRITVQKLPGREVEVECPWCGETVVV